MRFSIVLNCLLPFLKIQYCWYSENPIANFPKFYWLVEPEGWGWIVKISDLKGQKQNKNCFLFDLPGPAYTLTSLARKHKMFLWCRFNLIREQCDVTVTFPNSHSVISFAASKICCVMAAFLQDANRYSLTAKTSMAKYIGKKLIY